LSVAPRRGTIAEMLKAGERLGRFELLRELGRGSHGVVFEAKDTLLNERVAIKALQPWLSGDPTLRERFKRELILTRRLAHPGVCRLFDLHEDGDAFFISMQFIEGRSLSHVIRDDAPGLARIVRLMRGVCSALSAAHSQGVVHRDLKPANIMVDDNDHVVVLDFGIATATGVGQLTRPGQALGSVPYIAPEVWEGGAPTPLGDQYALGVIGFVAATGTLPYRGNNPLEVVDAIRAGTPTLRERWSEVDAGYEKIILRMIARDPAARFKDVAVVDAAFAELRLGAGLAVPTAPDAPAPVTLEVRRALNTDERDQNAPLLTVESGVVELPPRDPTVPLGSVVDGDVVQLPEATTPEVPALRAPAPISALASSTQGEASSSAPVSAVAEVAAAAPSPSPSSSSSSSMAPAPAGEAATGAFALAMTPSTNAGADVQKTQVDQDHFSEPTDIGPRIEREQKRADAPLHVRHLAVAAQNPDVTATDDDADLAADLAAARGPSRRIFYAVAALGGAAIALAAIVLSRQGPNDVAVDAVDAGVAVAAVVVDAGAAGVVPVVDAGALALALEDLPLEVPPDGAKPDSKRDVKRDPYQGLVADARAKGVRLGDVPAFDQAMAHARAATGPAREQEVVAAKKLLDGIVVDKAYVGRKLAYFNTAFDKAPAATQERLKPVSKNVLARLAKNDWRGANALLNQGFELLRKSGPK
jgi:serine/threonine protein kinase